MENIEPKQAGALRGRGLTTWATSNLAAAGPILAIDLAAKVLLRNAKSATDAVLPKTPWLKRDTEEPKCSNSSAATADPDEQDVAKAPKLPDGRGAWLKVPGPALQGLTRMVAPPDLWRRLTRRTKAGRMTAMEVMDRVRWGQSSYRRTEAGGSSDRYWRICSLGAACQ